MKKRTKELLDTATSHMARRLSFGDRTKSIHWSQVSQRHLLNCLKFEVEELENALLDGGDVWGEAADVSNFAAMLADNAARRGKG